MAACCTTAARRFVSIENLSTEIRSKVCWRETRYDDGRLIALEDVATLTPQTDARPIPGLADRTINTKTRFLGRRCRARPSGNVVAGVTDPVSVPLEQAYDLVIQGRTCSSSHSSDEMVAHVEQDVDSLIAYRQAVVKKVSHLLEAPISLVEEDDEDREIKRFARPSLEALWKGVGECVSGRHRHAKMQCLRHL